QRVIAKYFPHARGAECIAKQNRIQHRGGGRARKSHLRSLHYNTSSLRHPEVLGASRRASKDARPMHGPHPSRLARFARSRLRMTVQNSAFDAVLLVHRVVHDPPTMVIGGLTAAISSGGIVR